VLLNGERPEDLGAWRLSPVAEDFLVVRQVKCLRPNGRPGERAPEQSREHQKDDDAEHQVERREYSQHTSPIEVPQTDAASLFAFEAQQGRDEIATEEKEHGHPKQARNEAMQTSVAQEDN